MLQMVPYFFVWIPVGRVLGKRKHMKPRLTFNKRHCGLGSVRRRLVHDHDQVSLVMVFQHLGQEVNDLLRCDPFIVESKDQTAATCDRRHRRNAPTFSGHLLFGRLPARRPGFPQRHGERMMTTRGFCRSRVARCCPLDWSPKNESPSRRRALARPMQEAPRIEGCSASSLRPEPPARCTLMR